jgi:hypothetical protein
MQYDHVAFCLACFGSQGTGKTSWVLRYLANTKAKCRFLFDAEGEFAHKLGLRPVSTPEEITAAIKSGWVCYDPWQSFEDPAEALEWFSALVFKLAESALPGRKILVVDELQHYTTGHKLPRSLSRIIWTGRRRGIDFVTMAQAPNLAHNAIRGQLTEVVCFNLCEPNALEFPKAWGFDVAEIQALPLHHWIWRDRWRREQRGP